MQQEIKNALDVLKRGGVILYPTDTVWGLGCDATNESAVKKIFEIKQRPESKSLIVLVADENQLNRYVNEVPVVVWDLIETADNPFTIVYPDVRGLASNVYAEDKSIGIRIVKDEFCQGLIHRFGKPIVSTSANISGEPTPRYFDEISEQIISKVDYVVNWRQHETASSQPSSIIKFFADGTFQIIRK